MFAHKFRKSLLPNARQTPPANTQITRAVTAYQIPEADGGPCARSFEDAFILANLDRFALGAGDPARLAYEHAADQKKSTFALAHAIEHTEWNVPRYIADGLRWLAQGSPVSVVPPDAVAIGIVADVAGAEVNIAEAGGHG